MPIVRRHLPRTTRISAAATRGMAGLALALALPVWAWAGAQGPEAHEPAPVVLAASAVGDVPLAGTAASTGAALPPVADDAAVSEVAVPAAAPGSWQDGRAAAPWLSQAMPAVGAATSGDNPAAMQDMHRLMAVVGLTLVVLGARRAVARRR